jgi:hypothetical protein
MITVLSLIRSRQMITVLSLIRSRQMITVLSLNMASMANHEHVRKIGELRAAGETDHTTRICSTAILLVLTRIYVFIFTVIMFMIYY